MPIHCTCENRELCAILTGDIDHHGAKEIFKELEGQIDRNLPRLLQLDCSGVSFMDSSAIALLLRSRQRMSACGGQLRVIGVPAQGAKVLRAANLDKLISFE